MPLKRLKRLAREAGWTVEQTRNGHLRWTSPSGARVTSAGTGSDSRGVLNLVADLRRAGLDVPRKAHRRKSDQPLA